MFALEHGNYCEMFDSMDAALEAFHAIYKDGPKNSHAFLNRANDYAKLCVVELSMDRFENAIDYFGQDLKQVGSISKRQASQLC